MGNVSVSAGQKLASQSLNRRYFLDQPADAAALIESLEVEESLPSLLEQPADVLAHLWSFLSPPTGAEMLRHLPDDLVGGLVSEMAPNRAIRMLGQLEPEALDHSLSLVPQGIAQELRRLMEYPPDSAGQLMDARIYPFRSSMTVVEAVTQLRRQTARTMRSVYLIDSENKLVGKVGFQSIAIGEPSAKLGEMSEPIVVAVNAMTPHEEVAKALEIHRLADLPVVDMDGELIGVIYHRDLIDALQEETSVDIQTMVGASKDERALSRPLFAVRKRQPWLQINLLTAFLAASVVGIFESTIAQFTALAVLLPVVAGQSGNAGAQALAVTMRGLALREITIRHWLKVMRKEVAAGFLNGVLIAVTCGIGVFLWSGSIGLLLVIVLSMILAMVAAGFAGALVPIVLTRFGQDPAQASSIILTTVTDIAGFFSFLSIATLLASLI